MLLLEQHLNAENSGNYSDKTIQRYFERAANDAFGVFIKIR